MKKVFLLISILSLILFFSGCYKPIIDNTTVDDLVNNFVLAMSEESSEDFSSLHSFPLCLKRINGETANFSSWIQFNAVVAAMFVVYEFYSVELVDYSYSINGSIAEVDIEIYFEAYSKLDSKDINKELKMYWKARITETGWKIFYEEETYNHNLPSILFDCLFD